MGDASPVTNSSSQGMSKPKSSTLLLKFSTDWSDFTLTKSPNFIIKAWVRNPYERKNLKEMVRFKKKPKNQSSVW